MNDLKESGAFLVYRSFCCFFPLSLSLLFVNEDKYTQIIIIIINTLLKLLKLLWKSMSFWRGRFWPFCVIGILCLVASINGLIFIVQVFNACNYFILNGWKRCRKNIRQHSESSLFQLSYSEWAINFVLKWKYSFVFLTICNFSSFFFENRHLPMNYPT